MNFFKRSWFKVKRCFGYGKDYELVIDEEAGNNTKPNIGALQIFKRLFITIWGGGLLIRFLSVISMILLIAAKVCNVLTPQMYKKALDQLTVNKFPWGPVIGYTVIRLVASLSDGTREALWIRVSQYAGRQSALDTFKHLHQLSFRFHITRETGTVLRSVERGTDAIEWVLQAVLFNLAPTLFELLLISIILLKQNSAWFVLIILVVVGLYFAWTLTITEWRSKLRRESNDKNNLTNNRAVDSLINFETVKSFSNEEFEANRYNDALYEFQQASIKSKVSMSLLNFGQSFIITIGLCAVMFVAAYQVKKGKATIGDFVLINSYLLQLYGPLNFLGTSYRMIKTSLVDLENMYDLLLKDPEIADDPNATPLNVTQGKIEFKNIYFGYDPNVAVLKDVSFTIQPGTTTAIVGASGQGKSTISRLLFRFYDPISGEILIDGKDIRHVTQQSLRKNIGVVPQDCVLFNDTIEYNIRYGRPTASLEEVYEAAKLAKIHDFIMSLPDKYNTKVGERGLRLSGGEKQRVGIARAVLKSPKIMIYDEATSALDTKVEQEIKYSLDQISQGRSTLMVAHRLSTIQHVEQIIVLVNGTIAERGTHSELILAQGEYYTMWNIQQQQQIDEELRKSGETAAVDELLVAGANSSDLL